MQYTLTITAPDANAAPMIIPFMGREAREIEAWCNGNLVINADREWLMSTGAGVYVLSLEVAQPVMSDDFVGASPLDDF